MATATKTANGIDFEDAAERIQALNERVVESSRKAGVLYLDTTEKVLKSIADLEERVAQASNVEALTTIATAQADFTRDFAKLYTSAGRAALA
jgi:L-asparaginase II